LLLPIEVEFTPTGHLHLPMEVAAEHFPNDSVVALIHGPEMWLMPTHNASSGGFLLKRRNGKGDRTVLIWEVLGMRAVAGNRLAFWDESQGALRVALEAHHG
jgi:hydrogenase maturation protease